MSQKDKLFEKLKRNPSNIKLKDFERLLKKFGFIINKSNGKGSHFIYYHPSRPEIRRTVNKTNPLRKHHIITLLNDIEQVIK
ncbi:type II toxin-antitoxin system HicA family toxin [Staphylococcus hominis]|mgnify:FL=1|uniref:type II toxin-antitoxin system HicA family toxin n=1 Tax=Staphylococcus hominis TaxID=1290 RepID=UPI0034D7A4E3